MGREPQKCKQCGRIIYFDGICVSCRTENERNEILAWSQEQIDAAVQRICEEIETSGKLDKEQDIFTKLVNYRDIDTTKIAKCAFAKRCFYPGEMYKDAPDDVIHAMIELLRQDNINTMMEANHLLISLAIHGGEDVFRAFVEFEKNPPKWREKVYVNPSVYATYGGWSFDSDGNALKTNFDKCYPMVKGTLEEKKHSPVKIGARPREKCACGSEIVNLMEIDGRDPRLDFLGINGVIKAKCCPNCVMWSDDNFSRYTLDGESEMIVDENRRTMDYPMSEEALAELESNLYILGDAPVPPRYAADWEGGSSVGGVAFWIQDCDIKHCPDCGKPMKYLAQIQWDAVLDGWEGNAYIEICQACKTMAVLHQQT